MNHQSYTDLCELFDDEPDFKSERWEQLSDSEKRLWVCDVANHWHEMQRALIARERMAKSSKAMDKAVAFDDEKDC